MSHTILDINKLSWILGSQMASRISLFSVVCLLVLVSQTLTYASEGDSGSRVLLFRHKFLGRSLSICSHGLFSICRLQMQRQHLEAALPPEQLFEI